MGTAIEAAAIRRPARIYDLRSTLASDALAAGVSVFELARIMGTSVRMIERHYGTLLDGAGAGIAGRLDALDSGAGPGCGSHLARLIRRGRLSSCIESGGLPADGYPGQTFVARLRVERSSFGLQRMEPA